MQNLDRIIEEVTDVVSTVATAKRIMTMNEDEDRPITKRQLDRELERFRIELRTEELAKQTQRVRYMSIALTVLMVMTLYFFILLRLLEWKLAK